MWLSIEAFFDVEKLRYLFLVLGMDNVHFSLDNYDLPLCNFTRMAFTAHFSAHVCVLVGLCLYDTIGSLRFVCGAVRNRKVNSHVRANTPAMWHQMKWMKKLNGNTVAVTNHLNLIFPLVLMVVQFNFKNSSIPIMSYDSSAVDVSAKVTRFHVCSESRDYVLPLSATQFRGETKVFAPSVIHGPQRLTVNVGRCCKPNNYLPSFNLKSSENTISIQTRKRKKKKKTLGWPFDDDFISEWKKQMRATK